MNKIEKTDAIPPLANLRGALKLETARLILRDWVHQDIPDLIEGLNDIKVTKWLACVPFPYTQHLAEGWIQHCNDIAHKSGEKTDYEFAIELKSEKKVIGGVSLNRINRMHGTAGGGIWLNSKFQGSGYGSEAFGERIRFAFEDLGLRRLENGFFKGNDASLAMQERFGFRLEGEKRKAHLCMAEGEYKDECITGLLKEDWIKPNPR